jgi:hypothetical protein
VFRRAADLLDLSNDVINAPEQGQLGFLFFGFPRPSCPEVVWRAAGGNNVLHLVEVGDGSFRELRRSLQLSQITVVAVCGGTDLGEGLSRLNLCRLTEWVLTPQESLRAFPAITIANIFSEGVAELRGSRHQSFD